jgi:hypothetical protein
MPQYSGDPRWITARFNSKCPCGHDIKKGERSFYYPHTKTALCAKPCGEKASAEFAGAAMDEALMTGQNW